MKYFIFAMLSGIWVSSFAQNWQSFGELNQPPRCFYNDLATDALLIGGTNGKEQVLMEKFVKAWKGLEYENLPKSRSKFIQSK